MNNEENQNKCEDCATGYCYPHELKALAKIHGMKLALEMIREKMKNQEKKKK